MEENQRVIVTDINMKFSSMVVFMVKWAFASIPAVLLIVVVWVLAAGLLAGLMRAAPRRTDFSMLENQAPTVGYGGGIAEAVPKEKRDPKCMYSGDGVLIKCP